MEVARPTADFKPSVWGSFFIDYSPPLSSCQKPGIEQRVEELKNEVKAMFMTDDLTKKLTLVDDLQRLGIYYHFELEITETIRSVHEVDDNDIDDVRFVALRFRLLRQEGYPISQGVFGKFKDGKSFRKELGDNVEGLIQLYEASMLGTLEEEILDEAMGFARGHMERIVMDRVAEEWHMDRIRRVLETPFHRGMSRLEARLYISAYGKNKARNAVLFELAKLDFNLLQSLHQAEIRSFSLWWKELGLMDKPSFARDRLAECYFWSLGVCFEPRYSRGRLFMAKLLYLISVMDDMYDAYGTLEELQLFTDAIERWDFHDVGCLPEYMRIFINSFASFMAEIDEELRKKGRLQYKHYIIESFKAMVMAFYGEVVWTNKGYRPTFEEYIDVSLMGCGHPMLTSVSLCLLSEDLGEDTLEWVLTVPKIVKASAMVCRLMDDIVSSEFEQRRVHLDSSLQIYMREAGTTKEEAVVRLNKMVEGAWKDINKEWLNPLPSRKHLNQLALNFTRMIEVIYKHEDCYTNPAGQMKENIALLLVHPIQD